MGAWFFIGSEGVCLEMVETASANSLAQTNTVLLSRWCPQACVYSGGEAPFNVSSWITIVWQPETRDALKVGATGFKRTFSTCKFAVSDLRDLYGRMKERPLVGILCFHVGYIPCCKVCGCM